MKFTIVPMQPRHIPQLAALETICFSDPWPEAAFLPELQNELSVWLVAEHDGRVAGYIGSQIVPDEADMMNLAVAPEFRRQGLGRELTLELFDALPLHPLTRRLLLRLHLPPQFPADGSGLRAMQRNWRRKPVWIFRR